MAEKATSLSLTPFLETYELKGYTLVEISCVILNGNVAFEVWDAMMIQLMVEKPKAEDDDQSVTLNKCGFV